MPFAPNPNSKRSIRRKHRGFTSLERDCRKHRRNAVRSNWKRTIGNKICDVGHQEEPPLHGGKLKVFMHTAGGSINYH